MPESDTVPGTLRAVLLAAARAAFAEVAGGAESAEYCGYALYSDADAGSVCCAVNTRAHLARAQAGDPDDAEYYRWTPAEWALEGVGHEHFAPLGRRLLGRSPTARGPELPAWREGVYEACVATLETLRAEGLFGPAPDTVVVFAVSDHEDPVREVEWIRRLNPPSQARRFARRLHDASART
ncbi:DUF4303 domain-containing protein [Streptomyces sp. NPDC020192]|uniref:DUF4303 domain-containing protein n=1 Tax=Streptomyces sp. NPDC020192 TaxID=3365066 RepID=UPI0037A2EED4